MSASDRADRIARVRAQAERYLRKVSGLSAEDMAWYEAAVSAALDEAQGDLGKALDLADAALAEQGDLQKALDLIDAVLARESTGGPPEDNR